MDIKEGDMVIIERSGYSSGQTVEQVARLTPTQIVTQNERRFRRSDGYGVGTNTNYISRVLTAREVTQRRTFTRLKRANRKLQTAMDGSIEAVVYDIKDLQTAVDDVTRLMGELREAIK